MAPEVSRNTQRAGVLGFNHLLCTQCPNIYHIVFSKDLDLTTTGRLIPGISLNYGHIPATKWVDRVWYLILLPWFINKRKGFT